MVGLQLLLTLATLLASDGAVTKSSLTCAYRDPSLCDLLKDAYEQNNDVLTLMASSATSFRRDMKEISDTNRAIRQVLGEKNRDHLRVPLCSALLLEASALRQLGSSCSGTKSELLEEVCKNSFGSLLKAIHSLVAAAMEITEGKQRQAISKAFERSRRALRKQSNSSDYSGLGYDLGMATLDVLERNETEFE